MVFEIVPYDWVCWFVCLLVRQRASSSSSGSRGKYPNKPESGGGIRRNKKKKDKLSYARQVGTFI